MRISLLIASLVLLSGCKSGTECKSWAGAYGERSEVSWGQCSDNVTYEIKCELLGPQQYTCKCIKGGTVGKSFDRTEASLGDKNESTRVANEACGWNLGV